MQIINNAQDMMLQKSSLGLMIFEADLKRNPKLGGIKDKYLQDTGYTLRFLTIALDMEEPLLFDNYMKWFGQLAYHMRFNIEGMKRHFEACRLIFKEVIEPKFLDRVMLTFDEGIYAFEKAYNDITPVQIEHDQFLNHLLKMDTDQAYQYVLQKIEEGMSIKDIYLNVFQPTLYKVGELWQQRIISVAKEHYITAAIQHIIGKLYPLMFVSRKESIYSMTAVCAGDELHEIGMRMIADFFELSGWDTHFLGSNLPINMITEHMKEHPTDVLAISATTSQHILEVKALIQSIKQDEKLKHIKVLVGGKVFNETPNLWKTIGADAYALEPEQAILLANLIVGESDE